MIDKRIEDLTATLRGLDDAAHIDLIRTLEDLKSACAAAQAKITAELDNARDKSVGAEVALARRESPHRGGRHLGFARAMQEMPNTLALLEAGELNEWRATLLVQETACLSRDDRATIDRELCSDAATLAGLGDRAISATARARAAELDPAALVRRARRAVGDRHVSIRPAPDTMTYVTALLPVADGVAVWANLKRDANNLVGTGQAGDRSRGQVMADLLVERVTGVETAAAQPDTGNVVISDEALFGDGEAPAHVDGYGDIPAAIARNPGTGALTGLESVARCFPTGLARFIDIRDRTCRTPWCDAPIRHRDHIKAHDDGGPTSEFNGAGLCAACNYAKQADGWRAEPILAPLHTYQLTTPSGHTYQSTAPPLPRPARKRSAPRRFEFDIIWAA